jgi:hypothetical protein
VPKVEEDKKTENRRQNTAEEKKEIQKQQIRLLV